MKECELLNETGFLIASSSAGLSGVGVYERTCPDFEVCLVLALSVAGGGVSGCNAIMGALSRPSDTPAVRGHWEGRVERVTVYDGQGKAGDALALEILDGPTAAEMRSSWEGHGPVRISQARGGGTRPLLAVAGGGVVPVD